jgi:hypothetical protein
MMKLRRRVMTLAVSAAAMVSACVLPTQASAFALHPQNWAQAPENAAGVVFHPFGDRFEVWDNVRDGIPVQVWYRYAAGGAWHRIVSRVHHGTVRQDLAEFPNKIEFRIDGHDRGGGFVRSPVSIYRTWGL